MLRGNHFPETRFVKESCVGIMEKVGITKREAERHIFLTPAEIAKIKKSCKKLLEKVGLTAEQTARIARVLQRTPVKFPEKFYGDLAPGDLTKEQHTVGDYLTCIKLTHKPTGFSAQGTGFDVYRLNKSLVEKIKQQIRG